MVPTRILMYRMSMLRRWLHSSKDGGDDRGVKQGGPDNLFFRLPGRRRHKTPRPQLLMEIENFGLNCIRQVALSQHDPAA
jgi:hypothetical protein